MNKRFFAVERWVDGFGADTWVDCIFETKDEAQKYVNRIKKKERDRCEPIKIVPCEFGKPIEQYFD